MSTVSFSPPFRKEQHEDKVRKAYIEALPYISLVKEVETKASEERVEGISEPQEEDVSSTTNTDLLDRRDREMTELRFEEIRFGDIYMKLPKDSDAIETAKTLLDMLKKRVEKKESKGV